MNLQDLDALAKGLAPVVSKLIDAATVPLLVRIAALEAATPEPGAKGDPGERGADGQDAEPVSAAQIATAVEAYLAEHPPENGKDAEPAQIRRMVDEAVAALPPTKDGKDAEPETIRTMVAEAVAALPKPEDGKSFTAEDAAPLIAEEVAKAVSALPAAEPGKDADPEAVRAMVDEAVSALPAPKDGKDADQAAIISEVVAALEPVIAEQIAGLEVDEAKLAGLVDEAVAKIPAPADGKSVTVNDVAPLIVEAVEKAVAALPPPKDGIGLAAALIDRDNNLVLTLTDGATKSLGLVVGKDGEAGAPGQDGQPGRDGVDGLGFDDLAVEFDGERTATLVFSKGDLAKSFPLAFPIVLDRGVYKAGESYQLGDGVTWGGSFWIAQRETSAKPETCDDWRLAIKRGRDGKDGPAGAKGLDGKDGPAGPPGRSWA